MYLPRRGAILIIHITFSATFITKLEPLNYIFKGPQPRRPSPCYGPAKMLIKEGSTKVVETHQGYGKARLVVFLKILARPFFWTRANVS